jgi:hypothetical protein
MKLFTVVHPTSSTDASDGGTSTGCGFSTAAGGCVWGSAAGTAGVVEPQPAIELADRTTSPMYISRRIAAELMVDSYNVFFLSIIKAAVIPPTIIINPIMNK